MFFFFSSNFVSHCLFSPSFLKVINFSRFLLTLASSLSSPLTIFSLPVSICWHVCAGLSQSLISALFSALMWLSPPFLIGKLFNPSLCHCAVSLSPSSPFTSLHLSRYSLSLSFPPLCTLTGLFLSLIVMAGSSPLHNAADIFPTGDPHCIWFKKKTKKKLLTPSPCLPAHTPLFPPALPSFSSSAGERFNKTGLFWPVIGPQFTEINA